jgi:hypothetical protein
MKVLLIDVGGKESELAIVYDFHIKPSQKET